MSLSLFIFFSSSAHLTDADNATAISHNMISRSVAYGHVAPHASAIVGAKSPREPGRAENGSPQWIIIHILYITRTVCTATAMCVHGFCCFLRRTERCLKFSNVIGGTASIQNHNGSLLAYALNIGAHNSGIFIFNIFLFSVFFFPSSGVSVELPISSGGITCT